MPEAALEALEEKGGLKPATVQVRRNLYDDFKKWVVDSAKKSLKELFASKEGRDGQEGGHGGHFLLQQPAGTGLTLAS
jgi:hypothetical protein